jgi:hypothetical protein
MKSPRKLASEVCEMGVYGDGSTEYALSVMTLIGLSVAEEALHLFGTELNWPISALKSNVLILCWTRHLS